MLLKPLAPIFWLAVYFALFTLVVRVGNGHWSPAVLERFPQLVRGDPSGCAAEQDDPLAPANGSRTLGDASQATLDSAVIFVHGYHDGAHKWRKLSAALDHDLQLQNKKMLAFFPCFPTHDMGALETGAARIHEAAMQVPPNVPIHIVGFSMGGLVVKSYLKRYAAEIDPRRVDVITINTPHHGVTSFFLGYITGDRSIVDMRMTSDLDPLGVVYGDNPILRELNDPALVSHFRFQTISGSFVTSPVNAFLGGAWLSHSDGMVPARSGHLRVPLLRDESSDAFLDGVPYFCGVDPNDPLSDGLDRQITFLRPLYEPGIFHSNLTNEPMAGRLVVELFRDDFGRLDDRECATAVELLEMDGHRPFALVMLVVPLIIIGIAGVSLGRVLGRRSDGFAVAIYGMTVAIIAFTWSAAAPQELMRTTVTGHLRAETLAVMGAVAENLWALPWFAYYLRRVRRFGELTPRQTYASGIAFGLVIAMFEQMIFVWTTAAVSRDITLMRLVLSGVPRVLLGWVMAWVFLERERLTATAIALAKRTQALIWARRALLLLPPALHAIYSALMFHATDMVESITLYVIFTLIAVALLLAQRARATTSSQSAARSG